MNNFQKLSKKKIVIFSDLKPFFDKINKTGVGYIERSPLNILITFFIWLKSDVKGGE